MRFIRPLHGEALDPYAVGGFLLVARLTALAGDLRYRHEGTQEANCGEEGSTILRQRSEYLGTVEAPDAKTAEAMAVKQFGLEGPRRQRLVVREEDYRD